MIKTTSKGYIIAKGCYKFTIQGNQEGGLNNPIPYTVTTTRSKYTKRYQRYNLYKQYIRASFNYYTDLAIRHDYQLYTTGFTILECDIYFKNKAHGDGVNVYKAIEDSLFYNDKYMCGKYAIGYDLKNPRVECILTIL